MKSDLKRARALYQGGKYAKAIRLLEPQVFRYRESFSFYYLLGMSCLRVGDTGGAKTYLDRALSLRPNETGALAGLAVVHLKRYEVADAIRCYLEIVDSDPHNRIARRGLRLLRRNADRERLTPLVESGKVFRLLPRHRRRSRTAVLVGLSIVIAAGAVVYALLRPGDRPTFREPEVAALTISDIETLAAGAGDVRYALSDREIRSIFDRAKRYFADFRDNLAIREINRLLLSNASPRVQEQARTILRFIPAPDFTTMRDGFTYAEVAADPPLYNGTYVLWRGRISNLEVGTDVIRFDLLVGYDTGKVLEGVAPVVLDFGVELSDGRPIEVLGRVDVARESFSVRGVSIHRLAGE